MSGLKMICKIYGGLICSDSNGNRVEYVWDYKRDRAVKSTVLKRYAKWCRYFKNKKRLDNKKLYEKTIINLDV